MLDPYITVLPLFLTTFYSKLITSVALNHVENVNKYDILPNLDKIKNEPEFGVLHTLRKYSEWSEKEEKLKVTFTSRFNLIQQKRNLIICLLRANLRGSDVLKWSCSTLISLNYKRRIIPNKLVFPKMINVDTQKWVGSDDLLISMTGLAYLQKIYLIPSEQMLNGLTVESNVGGFLNQLDCVLQSLHSLLHKSFATSVDWLHTALLHVCHKLDLDLISIMFLIGIQIHNSKFYELLAKTGQSTKSIGENVHLDDTYDMPIINGQIPPFQNSKRIIHFNTHRNIDTFSRFTDLCQGTDLQSAEQKAKLYCYFEKRKHPYLYINPVKVEQLSRNPLILQFYEIISNSSMETIQREIGPYVKSFNLFFDKNNVAEKNTPERITNSARMGIRNFAQVSNATYYLTGILSGLNILDHANHNVLGEYVYGRHFNIHNDGVYGTRSSEIPKDEDIIATMIFYLKLPRKGGCTAFIHAGVCSRKVTGSAIFWYDMYRNGTCTKELLHGSCPVYHGNKIAISFFFQHNENWKRRPCLVNRLK